MTLDPTEIVKTLITVASSLLVAFGTWNVTIKKDREKQMDEVRELINSYKAGTKEDIGNLKDDMIRGNATTQNQISILDLKMSELSSRVEKHNNVIERTYKLEQSTAVLHEQLKNLEDKVS